MNIQLADGEQMAVINLKTWTWEIYVSKGGQSVVVGRGKLTPIEQMAIKSKLASSGSK
jgi:hypothetical protein